MTAAFITRAAFFSGVPTYMHTLFLCQLTRPHHNSNTAQRHTDTSSTLPQTSQHGRHPIRCPLAGLLQRPGQPGTSWRRDRGHSPELACWIRQVSGCTVECYMQALCRLSLLLELLLRPARPSHPLQLCTMEWQLHLEMR